MNKPQYELAAGNPASGKAASAWLMLGLAALVFAGLYSLLLVLARTPALQQWTPFIGFFRVALVIHVNLSVLVWLMSVSAACWSMSVRNEMPRWDLVSFTLAVLGTLVMVIAPLAGAGEPLMNNYVPMLQHPVYYAGLVLFAAGIGSHLLRCMLSGPRPAGLDGVASLHAGIRASALIVAVAILAVLASIAGIPPDMAGQVYFEFLFWGSGHVLQFAYTLLMMMCWVVLASNSGCRFVLSPRLTLTFLVILALPVITVPFLYVAHEVVSPGHRLAFTELMKYGGLSCLPLGLAVVASLRGAAPPTGEQRHLRSALLASIVLFATGGVLGFMVAGLDIVIPAHYHGSTVGVTLAFMGLVYYLLPRLGFGALPARLAYWQPVIYGSGQMMHIMGLAWTGGYGVQRKTAGLAQGVDRFGEIAGMGLMGLGGLISVIGGVLFLLACYISIRDRK